MQAMTSQVGRLLHVNLCGSPCQKEIFRSDKAPPASFLQVMAMVEPFRRRNVAAQEKVGDISTLCTCQLVDQPSPLV